MFNEKNCNVYNGDTWRCATIHFLVKGIEANDINYRGEFTFSIKEETSYTWRGTEISPSDLEVGDTISITFSGEVLTIYPVIISNVIKVQLLEDEI